MPADLCANDFAIDDTTALLFSDQAPLAPGPGQQDARAVWTRVFPRPDPSVLIYLHGNNNYVAVDKMGRSRVPDWATTPAAHDGATGKPAAPLIYALDKLETRNVGKKPILLVPEDAVLTTGSFWAREPAGQYADPTRMGKMVADCLAHLACLKGPNGHPYLSGRFAKGRQNRLYVCGHSGAGLPLEEAATSALILPETGVPTDLWLFDCTYWSQVKGFVQFCARWQAAGRLKGGDPRSARFICVYRPKTQTEPIADSLRQEIAGGLGVPADSLVIDHTAANYASEVQPSLTKAPVMFVRTYLPHDDIPTFFIPELLRTAVR